MEIVFKILVGIVAVVALLGGWIAFNSKRLKNAYRDGLKLDDVPLQGDNEAVHEATAYRDEVRDRVIKGLMKMGAEGGIWFGEVQGAFVALTDAAWWLQMRPQLDDMEITVLVQTLSFLPMGAVLSQQGINVGIFAGDEDGNIREVRNL